jgi:hypothetical protein
MPATTSRRAAFLAGTVLLVLLLGGCGGQSETSTAASTPSTSTPEPTTTTIPPFTAEEDAWLDGLTKLKEGLEKDRNNIYRASSQVTRAVMVMLGKTMGRCSQQLARLGSPSDRLQPASTLATKACQQLGKAAKCHAAMARLSSADGGVVVGSPQERPWHRASDCAQAAEQKGLKLLEDAHGKGTEIRIIATVGHD